MDRLLAQLSTFNLAVGVKPTTMQASAVKQFVDWMHLKIGMDALLELATFSEPARVEEYTRRITTAVSHPSLGKLPHLDTDEDAEAAKHDALIGIGHCSFS